MAIDTRRETLEVELAIALRTPAFPSTADAVAYRDRKIEAIEERLRALPPRPLAAPTGMAHGPAVIIDRRLGSEYARPEPSLDYEPSLNAHEWDPWEREYGK